MRRPWKRDERVHRWLLVSVSIIVGITASCVAKPTTRRQDGVSQQGDSKPQETPVPFQPTEQNKSRRCAARNYPMKDYPGILEDVPDGTGAECYRLQEMLIKSALEGNLEKIREALRDGANTQATYYMSYPALHSAAMTGQADAVRLLLDNGADVNQVDNTWKVSPLDFAANYGHTNVVQVLLARGADVCHKETEGTAGDIAQARGHKELAELLKTAQSTKCK
jgi:hypothetical protein